MLHMEEEKGDEKGREMEKEVGGRGTHRKAGEKEK